MTGQRFVVVGVAHTRSAWFTEVARWATLGSLPVDFVKCLSVGELAAQVDGGRPLSAALVDGRLAGVDRDLLDLLARRGVPALVVAAPGVDRPWADLGAAAVLPHAFTASALADALADAARPVPEVTDAGPPPPRPIATNRAPTVAVLGRSGAGTSTMAAALAQELAADDPAGPAGSAGGVVLADLARHAQQALLHDAGDVVPGLPELVEAHRHGALDPDQALALTYGVPERGYRLLLGLRRHRDWTTLGARSLRAALDGLGAAASWLVIDTDADLEGEAETGSFDVEDRNLLARTAVRRADVVVALARPSATGLHGLVVLLDDLGRAGVPAERILVALNEAPRLPRARATLAAALAGLTDAAPGDTHGALCFVPERRGLDDVHLAVSRFPGALGRPVRLGAATLLARCGRRDAGVAADDIGVRIRPGELSAP